MNQTSNWSQCICEHAASCTGEDAPWYKPRIDAMPYPAATTIDWSSAPLRFHTDYYCASAPPPNPELTPACLCLLNMTTLL